jgi:hypothetical protein
MQTLQYIQRFREWGTQPLHLPFHFTVMSATPPEEIGKRRIFPQREEQNAALDDKLLRKRINAAKPAALIK